MKSITQVLMGTAFVYLTSFVPAATAQMPEAVRHPPQSGWLDELGRLKGGRAIGLGVAPSAPYWLVQNCPAAPSAASCSRMYWRTCSNSNPTVDTA